MVPVSIGELTEVVRGQLFNAPAQGEITGAAFDTRQLQPGDAFFAFSGATQDGHHYVPQAFAVGAAVAIVTNPSVVSQHPGRPIVVVEDALAALQSLAQYERHRFDGTVIGVTGSNGKTTTKDMLATVFSTSGPCLATQGNYNNELGVPVTILGRTADHRTMVLEMGMRGTGQIAALCEIAKPTAGIITNIGTSHLELLGSQADIAAAKSELLEALPAGGYAALWADDPWLRAIADKCRGRVLWYGMNAEQASANDIDRTDNGVKFTARVLGKSKTVFLPTFGLHNVRNALGALLLGAIHGLHLSDMADALAALPSSSGRLHITQGLRRRQIIDDCYNASPLSMRASLDVLKHVAGDGTTVAVLGDMYELGSLEEQGHTEVGSYVAEIGIDCLVAIGPKSEAMARAAETSGCRRVHYYPDKQEALADISTLIPSDSTVLVKASRGMKLEEVVQVLTGMSGINFH